MRQLTGMFWGAGLLFGLLIGFAALAAGCGEDEPAQSSAQRTAVQEQPQQEQRPAAQQAAQEDGQETRPQAAEQEPAAAAEQSSQSEQQSTSAAQEQQDEQQAGSSVQQQGAQQQAMQRDADQESVPEGTRLISLFGDITEIVYALGAEQFLIARDTSSIYPPQAEELPNLGFTGELNAEAILSFQPTLVIGTPLAGPPGVLEQLEQSGVEVLIIEDLNGLDASQIKIRIVGEALGIPQRAEALALDVEKRMQAVIAAAENHQPLRVLHVYIRRGGLQLVSGAGNKAETIITAAGGIDAAAEVGIVGWQPLTPEALVAADPDVYLVMDRGLGVIGGIEGLLEIPGMAETKAGRGPHIISMPDLYLLGFGPRLPEAIADLAEYLQAIRVEAAGE